VQSSFSVDSLLLKIVCRILRKRILCAPNHLTVRIRKKPQLRVEKSSQLVMHMLVLYANTGCKMDLASSGYTVGVINKMLPACEYTPCIEEHNIHAIFRWPSVWDIHQHVFRTATSTACFQNSTVEQADVEFLKQTGLTLSVTTLGTCIYWFGKKRGREVHTDTYPCVSLPTHYSNATEQMIFKACKYVHNVVATS